MYFYKKKVMFKYLLLIGLIYMIVKYNTLKSNLSSMLQNQNQKINNNDQNNDSEGEYVDYEEVD